MAWVRINDKVLGDLKILRLSDSAFRLWVVGLCYCQQHLTDGLIPHEAMRFLYAKRKDVDILCSVLVEGKSSLWERIDGFGFKVHDYLDWNDSKETILRKREGGKTRASQFRNGVSNSVSNSGNTAHTPSGVLVVSSRSSERKEGPFTNETITERAGRFVERYEAMYSQHRNARYLVRPARDYNSAVEVCQTWTDDTRLDKLAAIFLTTDHTFAESGSRTITQFASMASWCDAQLAKWEAKQVSA